MNEFKLIATRMMDRYRVLIGSALVALLTLVLLPLITVGRSQTAAVWSLESAIGLLSDRAPENYVGSQACASCHAGEARDWTTSHHAKAMAVAASDTVRGDFSGGVVEVSGARGRFFQEGGRYRVETEGRDGQPAVFTVSHTFGWEPLQQYLVAFPDGRLQALPWAWDTRPKAAGGQRWFHVYGIEPITHKDSRHWTRSQQNWNHMCAECHSTALDKTYDPPSNTFRTSFSEISVGCESCHGPGRSHVSWTHARTNDPKKGFAAVRPARDIPDWTIDPRTGSPARSVARLPGDEVETCARCHSRRGQISKNWVPGQPMANTHLPSFLTADLFEDDGQMKDEVFNDHSFRQSLMYAKGVTCGDCHDPHSARLKATGATVCSQCHLPEKFSAFSHTGHPAGPGAPDCISCHMPSRTYMVVDTRHDHSFRIPRPDQSVTLGTPNACNDCHKDRPAQWAADAVTGWHGPVRKGHQRFASAFHAARKGDPDARERLIAIAGDPVSPGIARATAVMTLQAWPSATAGAMVAKALSDPDPLVRVAALRGLESEPAERRWLLGSDALSDPVRIVRLTAAELLADQAKPNRSEAERQRLAAAFSELEASLTLNADRAESHGALGVFRQKQGRAGDAEAAYLAALRLEPGAATISANLADLYRISNRESAAEQTLRTAIVVTPASGFLRHALGLSLIRQKRYPEALEQLAKAVELEPGSGRHAYVYSVALQSLGRASEAILILQSAAERNPADVNILTLLLQTAMRDGRSAEAAPLAERLSRLQPDNPELARLAARLKPRH